MMRIKNNENSLEKYFSQASKPFLNLSVGGYVFLGVLLGLVFGILAYGLLGVILNFCLMLLSIFLYFKGRSIVRLNKYDKRIFLYANYILLIITFYIVDMSFCVVNMVLFNEVALFNYRLLSELIISIIFILVAFISEFIILKSKISINDNILNKFENDRIIISIGAIGSSGGASIGYFFSRLTKGSTITAYVICILVFLITLIMVFFCVVYVVIYIRLKQNEKHRGLQLY
jgi:hypothetical protein